MSAALDGLTVAVTASRRANELAHLISSQGGKPYLAPTVGIESNRAVDSEAERFCDTLNARNVDYAVFMTGPGVFALFAGARAAGRENELVRALSKTCVVARSGKPKDALSKHGARVDLVPREATSTGLLELLAERGIVSKVILILTHGSDSSSLSEGLRRLGAEVLEFSTYSYSLETDTSGALILDSMKFNPVLPFRPRGLELVQAIIDGEIDVVTFTSPPSAKNLFMIASGAGLLDEMLGSLGSLIVVVVGPPTGAAVEAGGVRVDVMPSVYKMGPMIKELCDYVKKHGLKNDAGKKLVRPDKG